jgi:wyosine [tRNA(Phe)-imidazoG37] synthetase (radical SAM superfamily)
MQIARQPFYEPTQIIQAVQGKVDACREAGQPIDYLTFVPDGEPTLDINLGREIELLRPLGIKIAVISNASLIGQQEVREDLRLADWVSLKVDSTRETVWRQIDRPHGRLSLRAICDGLLQFAASYRGQLVTETMLVQGINDDDDHLLDVADFLGRLQPVVAYLAVPTRPPAEGWVQVPGEAAINRAYQLFSNLLGRVETLIGYEGNAFAVTGDVREDLLSILAVHPMREDAVREYLRRAGASWAIIDNLLAQDQLMATAYQGSTFYIRKLQREWAGSSHCRQHQV